MREEYKGEKNVVSWKGYAGKIIEGKSNSSQSRDFFMPAGLQIFVHVLIYEEH